MMCHRCHSDIPRCPGSQATIFISVVGLYHAPNTRCPSMACMVTTMWPAAETAVQRLQRALFVSSWWRQIQRVFTTSFVLSLTAENTER